MFYVPPRSKIKPKFLEGLYNIENAVVNQKRWHDMKGLPHPVLYLPMWEGSGNISYDLGSLRKSGLINTQNTFWAVDNYGLAVLFPGAPPGYIQIGGELGLWPGYPEFTIVSCINPTNSGNTQIMAADSNITGERAFQFRTSAYKLQLITFVGGVAKTAASTASVSGASVVACVCKNGNNYTYINGKPDGSVVSGGGCDTDAAAWVIGARNARTNSISMTEGFYGKIGLSVVYDFAFSDDQVSIVSNECFGALYPISPPVYFFKGAGAPPATGNPWYYYAQL